MTKTLICIECPSGCSLTVATAGQRVVSVEGGRCLKGEAYAVSEIENPVRVVTSTVVGRGLEVRMIPVRTDRPIPKARVLEAMEALRKIRIDKPVSCGEILLENFLDLGVRVIATRTL